MFIILGQLVILTSCLKTLPEEIEIKPLQAIYFNYFDTVSNIFTYAGDGQEKFEENTKPKRQRRSTKKVQEQELFSQFMVKNSCFMSKKGKTVCSTRTKITRYV